MSQTQTVGKHETVIYSEGGYTIIRYHATSVVKFNHEEIILNSAGYETVTTKLRMNQASNQFDLGFHVYQENWLWYVDYNGIKLNYADDMVIKRN